MYSVALADTLCAAHASVPRTVIDLTSESDRKWQALRNEYIFLRFCIEPTARDHLWKTGDGPLVNVVHDARCAVVSMVKHCLPLPLGAAEFIRDTAWAEDCIRRRCGIVTVDYETQMRAFRWLEAALKQAGLVC